MVFQQPDEHRSSTTSASKARKRKTDVTEARSRAQRTKLDEQAQARKPHPGAHDASHEGTGQASLQARRRASMTLACAIDDYLQDHEGGNHSKKTLEWYHTSLDLLHLLSQVE